MKTSKSQIALEQLNKIVNEIKADEFPTPEMDNILKQIRKVVKILNPTPVKTAVKTAKKTAKKQSAKK